MPTTASIGFAPEDARPTVRTSDRRRRKGLSCHRAGAGRKQLDKQESASSPPPKAVAERLEALRNLVPTRTGGAKETAAAAATDRLFEETAEYILLLRSQVAVLKRLVAAAYMDKSDDTA